MPAISIIVPVYKVEPYLRRCVDSILGQSYADFELILVDDGSPDNCPAICDEYAARDSRVVVIHQENGGLSAARNAGIERASGEFLCFVDSDDIVSTRFCQVLYTVAVQNQCMIVACKMQRFTEGDISTECNYACPINTTEMTSFTFIKEQMGRAIEIGVCGKLFHSCVFEKICFAVGKLHEDIIFAGDLLKEPEFFVTYVDTPLYYYRQRAGSIMNGQAADGKCSPHRVWAGNYLLECAKTVQYPYLQECLRYAVDYPWYFVDGIYVKFQFDENREFLDELQAMLRRNCKLYEQLPLLDNIRRHRMMLFAKSRFLYGFNAYTRLLRVYLYHILRKDAYSDGHGI